MKIKKFRIRPNALRVGRVLKQNLGVRQLPPEVELMVPELTPEFLGHIAPAAFYHTWNHEEIPPALRQIVVSAGHTKAIAVTALAATIGATADEYLGDVLVKGETTKAQVLTALSDVSSEHALEFLFRLLVDDAKSDDCEVSEPIPVTETAVLAQVLELLEADREGIIMEQGQHLSPRFSKVALAAWWPIAKKKRTTTAQKKKTA